MRQMQDRAFAHMATAAPVVGYAAGKVMPAQPDLLAAFTFGTQDLAADDPRHFAVALEPLGPPVTEVWRVDARVRSGRDGPLRWSAGGGWLFAGLDLHGDGPDRIEALAREGYARLCRFLQAREERHVLRIWNYLGAINAGEGDEERYKRFCDGRAAGMGDFFAAGFPAATAIGHRDRHEHLQVYCLAATAPGTRVENPRQISAWTYPRQYGITPPSFARAIALPGGRVLAISGTASIVGHASRHEGDLKAQLDETLANLRCLLDAGHMPPGFGPDSPLKVYLRHPEQAAEVRACLQRELPDTPLLLLHGDVCRRELLVEIDGWRYA